MIKYGIIMFFIFASNIFSQMSGSIGISDPRSMAIGKSSVITSTGVYAIHHNPANMALFKDHSTEISTLIPIPNASLFIGNEFISLNDYNYFFGGVINENGEKVARFLDANDKARLRKLFADGSSHNMATSVNLFSIVFKLGTNSGALGFSLTDVAGESGTIPIDLVDIWLYGNEVGRNYNLSGFDLHSFYIREYALSYSKVFNNFLPRTFKQFSAGLTLKLVHGFAYTKVERSNISIETREDYSIDVHSDFLANMAFSKDFGINWDFENEKRESNFTPFPEPAGVGFGFSFGFNAKLNNAWSMALALTDIGSIKWENEAVEYSSFGDYIITDVTDSTLTDTLETLIQPQGAYSDGFTTNLPTALRFGLSLDYRELNKKFSGDLLFILSYAQGFNNEPTNTTNPRVSLGVEWKPSKTIPIRSGFSFGGINKFEWGLGFGLDFGLIEMNFATSDVISLFKGGQAKKNVFAFGSRWKF